MSISSISTNPWANPWAEAVPLQLSAGASVSIDATETLQGGFDQPAALGSSFNPSATDTTASLANPLQSLSADIQAMLIQAQNTAATPATTATTANTTTSGTTAVSPEQQLATDLQTLMSDLQSANASGGQTATSGAQTASVNPADTGQVAHHHHHHHHDGGGDAGGDSSVASATTTATANSTSTASDAAVAQSFAGDIMQALQSYVGAGGKSSIPSVMA